jgi:spore coat protein U-like protein
LDDPSAPAFAVDFPNLTLGGDENVVPLYGRVFGGQTAAPVGLYESMLTPIQSRITDYVLLFPPSCTTVTTTPVTVGSVKAQLKIETACTIDAAPLDFGNVTNLATVSPSASNLSVTCTSGGAYTVALDGGESGNVNARRMTIDGGSAVINYQLYRPTGVPNVWGNTSGLTLAGTGTGLPQSLQVHGVVLPAQGPKPAGTYRDTITATITF